MHLHLHVTRRQTPPNLFGQKLKRRQRLSRRSQRCTRLIQIRGNMISPNDIAPLMLFLLRATSRDFREMEYLSCCASLSLDHSSRIAVPLLGSLRTTLQVYCFIGQIRPDQNRDIRELSLVYYPSPLTWELAFQHIHTPVELWQKHGRYADVSDVGFFNFVRG